MSLIIKNVYLGSYQEAQDRELLKSKNIKGIIVAAKFLDVYFPEDFIYVKFELGDFENQPIFQYFTLAFQFIDAFVNRNENVFVHCFKGASRSSTIVIAYLMYKAKNLKFQKALEYAHSIRSKVNPNKGFRIQLMMFEEMLEVYNKILTELKGKKFNKYEILKQVIKNYNPNFESLNQRFPEITKKFFRAYKKSNYKYYKWLRKVNLKSKQKQANPGTMQKMKDKFCGFFYKAFSWTADKVTTQNKDVSRIVIRNISQELDDRKDEFKDL